MIVTCSKTLASFSTAQLSGLLSSFVVAGFFMKNQAFLRSVENEICCRDVGDEAALTLANAAWYAPLIHHR